jgi:hypothetical protein
MGVTTYAELTIAIINNGSNTVTSSIYEIGDGWLRNGDAYQLVNRNRYFQKVGSVNLDFPADLNYGLYQIQIGGRTIVADFRDGDYQDGKDQYGTSYLTADMALGYDYSSQTFFKLVGSDRITLGQNESVNIWGDGRKSTGSPNHSLLTVPVLLQNNFSGGAVRSGSARITLL